MSLENQKEVSANTKHVDDVAVDSVERNPMRSRAQDWKLGRDFYDYVREGYDGLAPTYDEEIGSNPIGRRMREVFRNSLREAVRPGSLVFEIGCGTGLDALWLARQGIEVVATDISQEMVARVVEKAKAEGLADRVRGRRLAAREIGRLHEEFGSQVFGGGYCHAGAINMEPELGVLPRQIRSLLKPGAPFVASVVNRISLFEVLFYPAVLRPRKAFRRLNGPIPIPISRREPFNRFVIPARFYTPRELIRAFGDGFTVEGLQGMQIFLPPSNLADEYNAVKPVFAPLEFLERRLSKRRPLNSWGHHFIVTFRRR